MLNLKTFGERLKQIRQERGISQDKLSKLTNISVQTISAYETGQSCPSLEYIHDIALVLNVSIDYLTYGNIQNISLVNDEKIDDYKQFINKILNLIDTNLIFLKIQDNAFLPKTAILEIRESLLVSTFEKIKKYVDDKDNLDQSTYRLIINNIADSVNTKINK